MSATLESNENTLTKPKIDITCTMCKQLITAMKNNPDLVAKLMHQICRLGQIGEAECTLRKIEIISALRIKTSAELCQALNLCRLAKLSELVGKPLQD